MTSVARIGVALVGGYVLGRTKKGKTAVGLGMFLAGRKLGADPRDLGRRIAGSPLLGQLDGQVRQQLVDVTRTAAADALTRRIDGLAESLHERTTRLEEAKGGEDGARPPSSGPDARDRPEDGSARPGPQEWDEPDEPDEPDELDALDEADEPDERDEIEEPDVRREPDERPRTPRRRGSDGGPPARRAPDRARGTAPAARAAAGAVRGVRERVPGREVRGHGRRDG